MIEDMTSTDNAHRIFINSFDERFRMDEHIIRENAPHNLYT